jgi:hypothetical protein
MSAAIPKWAYDEAAQRCNTGNSNPLTVEQWKYHVSFNELAKCIAAHEEPPVDPLLIEAREIAAKFYIEAGGGFKPNHSADVIRRGEGDQTIAFQCAFAALKRGIELASKSEPLP